MNCMQVSTVDHPALALLPDAPTRDQIERFGAYLFALETSHGAADVGTRHHHVRGLYGRSVDIKAGTFGVGVPHKDACFVVCIGDIETWTAQGRQRFTGLHIVESNPGPRIVFAHADTTWFTVHRNDTGTTDIEAIEAATFDTPERLLSRRAVTSGELE